MRRPIPHIQEPAEQLKALIQQSSDAQQRQRLHALYLLQSQQAKDRKQLALSVGVHRNTISRWLKAYEQGGLNVLLTVDKPPGKQPTLTPQIGEAIRLRLTDPQGLDSYQALWRWVCETYDISVAYKTVYKFVRYGLGAKLKVVRPSHIKKQG